MTLYCINILHFSGFVVCWHKIYLKNTFKKKKNVSQNKYSIRYIDVILFRVINISLIYNHDYIIILLYCDHTV